jgi:hypothetical protein
MKADFRISVKDYSRGKNLKVQLCRVPFGRQFIVRMNGQPWPASGRPVSLSKVFAALRKAVVRSQSRPAATLPPSPAPEPAWARVRS